MSKFDPKLSKNWEKISCEFLFVFVFAVFSQDAEQVEAALQPIRRRHAAALYRELLAHPCGIMTSDAAGPQLAKNRQKILSGQV